MADASSTARLGAAARGAAEALGALLELFGQDVLLGASSLLRCIVWLLLGLVATLSALLLTVAGIVAAALWLGLPPAWALLSGAMGSALMASCCSALARRRLGTANLAATRRQCRAFLLALVGRTT